METYFANMVAEEGTKERLVQDLRTLLHDAEDLALAAGQQMVGKSREELLAALERVKTTCRRVDGRARGCVKTADRVVRDNPYPTLGFAFAAGLLIGILATRNEDGQ